MDDRTAKNIATLDPKVQDTFKRLWALGQSVAEKYGCTYIMISGNRTYAEQKALYAQGRTAPGNKVTNARPGYSNHNFGLAGDMGVFRGKVYLDDPESERGEPELAKKIHRETAAAAATAGLQVDWGGSWKGLKDFPHFEYKTGLTMAQKRERMAKKGSVL